MSRKDFYHDLVRAALIKAGWGITDEQLPLRFFDTRLYIDLAAAKTEADGSVSRIAVEVKNFRDRFDYVNEFQKALGQYLMYRQLLQLRDLTHVLYLAVPENASSKFFQNELIQQLLVTHSVKLITFDPETQTIARWNP